MSRRTEPIPRRVVPLIEASLDRTYRPPSGAETRTTGEDPTSRRGLSPPGRGSAPSWPQGPDQQPSGVNAEHDSAVRARAASPTQDGCRPDDTPAALTTGLDRGATQRWTIALAHAAGLGVVAENPGPPDLPNTGETTQSDSEAEQMVQAGSYARGCDVEAWYPAFEDQLFEPGSGIDVASYGRVDHGEPSPTARR